MEERKSVDSAPQSQDRSCKVKKVGNLTMEFHGNSSENQARCPWPSRVNHRPQVLPASGRKVMATDSLDTRLLVGKQSYTPYPVALENMPVYLKLRVPRSYPR